MDEIGLTYPLGALKASAREAVAADVCEDAAAWVRAGAATDTQPGEGGK